MIGFHRDTITVLRAELVTDAYNNEVFDWPNAARTDVSGCRVQPDRGTDNTLDREAITTRWRLFAPAGTDLLATDRVEHQGVVYVVEGSVEDWPSPTGRLAHIEALLRRTDG